MTERTINGLIPKGFILAHPDAVDHPDNPTGRMGSLIRCEATGIYCLLVGGAVMSVPQRWAREVAAAQRLKVPIFAEHCTMAGRVCLDGDTIDAGSDDLVVYEGTRRELLETAVSLEQQAATAGAGHDAYLRRVAASLREAVE